MKDFAVAPTKYDEGYEAFGSGAEISDCPYPIGTNTLRYSWLAGWLQARQDSKSVKSEVVK